MTVEANRLLTLVQWLSPAYPVGSFAWSHGLESVISEGLVNDAASLEAWLSDLLFHGAGRTDAILIFAAHGATGLALDEVAELALALQPAAERRAESLAQGYAFATVTRAVGGHSLPDGLPYAVALGHAAGLEGMRARVVAELYLQAFVTNLVQAAQRLMPLGQTAAHGVIARLAPVYLSVAAEAEGCSLDDIGGAGFAMDIAAMRHETLEPRLFRS